MATQTAPPPVDHYMDLSERSRSGRSVTTRATAAIEILDSIIDLGSGRSREEEDYLRRARALVEHYEDTIYQRPELPAPSGSET